ncbi:venom metalloproteinase antarease-like TtrivMP_A isoform X1 [Amblyomma americanum]
MTLFTFIAVFIFCTSCRVTGAPTFVFPQIFQSRSKDGEKVLTITRDLTLNLQKSSVFAPEFFIHSTRDGAPVRYHMQGPEMEKNLYHSVESMASVDVSEEEGVKIEGIVGDRLRIKPTSRMARSLDGADAHLLYTAEEPVRHSQGHSDYGIPANEALFSPEPRSLGSERRRLPEEIHPELHIVVDYQFCLELAFDEKKISKYLAIMTNSANLRFRSMVQPRVQLRIVGITVTKDVSDEPYIVHLEGYNHTKNILYEETVQKFNAFVLNHTYFADADIVFLLTGRNMSRWKDGTLHHRTGGFAYLGGVCTKWKVGMSEERAQSFYGVYVYAHELAHSLGCAHDGDGASIWPAGHIGSEDCSWYDGYMMSYEFVKPNMFFFSDCCQREVMNIYNRPNYRCLREESSQNTGLSVSQLPGEVSDLDTFCQKVYNMYPYVEADMEYNMSSCEVRCYIDKALRSMIITAVDGVKCGKDKICILGNCTLAETKHKQVNIVKKALRWIGFLFS